MIYLAALSHLIITLESFLFYLHKYKKLQASVSNF